MVQVQGRSMKLGFLVQELLEQVVVRAKHVPK